MTSMKGDRVAFGPSERRAAAWARSVGPADENEVVEVSVLVRPQSSDKPTVNGLSLPELGAQPIERRSHLSRQEYAAAQGASSEDLTLVEEFAREYNLDVVEVSQARRTVRLSGTVRNLSEVFGVTLEMYENADGRYRGRVGALQIPTSLAGIVTGVFGLDSRSQAQPHFRFRAESGGATQSTSYTPLEVAKLYDFPPGQDGRGECIAIIELGGGFRTKDIRKYFAGIGLKAPSVVAVSIDGAKNSPTTPNGDDGEVMLDIEVAGGVAPGAQLVVYFAPNSTDKGFLDAITTAVHDSHHQPSVISISWGGPEPDWTQQALDAFDQAFQDAAAMGVTVCCASGDSGSSDGLNDGGSHVDFPASSPYVLGCGGTSLQAKGGQIQAESVWNDGPGGGASGGGVSSYFPVPTWQAKIALPPPLAGRGGRGVPDVAGDADPQTGYQVLVDGQQGVIGGTSAVAPLWAGLIARTNQALGKSVGYLNPLLYQQLAGGPSLHDILNGNNGAYSAAPGWDPCTGLGSPDGSKLLTSL